MQIERLKSKIHRATVTDSDLHYEGSITIDKELMEAADLVAGEKVQVVDINNGNRLETYVIAGRPGSSEICLNGAAARLVEVGDRIIIISYGMMASKDAADFEATIVKVDENNKIVES